MCFSGTTLPAASRNQPRKMYQAALPWLSPGIGSSIGRAESTPNMARHPAMTNKATLGARKFMKFLSDVAELRPGPKLQRFRPFARNPYMHYNTHLFCIAPTIDWA